MQELLSALKNCVDEETQKSKEFPKSARGLRSKLVRVNPNLRAVGINVMFGEKTENGRMVIIEKVCKQSSEPSDRQEAPQKQVNTPDGSISDRQPTVSQPSGR